MFKILILICLAIFSYADNVNILKGEIKAHTEVFGDSKINPKTSDLKSKLTKDDSITSLRGNIYFDTLSLISDKKDRDENMYELLNVQKFKTISFDISHILKDEKTYLINGILTLNGISKKISSNCIITKEADVLKLSGNFSINLSDYGMEPPTMFFLTVRNQIDITYDLELK